MEIYLIWNICVDTYEFPKSVTKRKDNLVVKAGEREIWFPFWVLPHISYVTLGKSWTVTYLRVADLHVNQTEPSLLCKVMEMFHLLVHMKSIERSKWKVLEEHKLSVMVLYIVTVINKIDIRW